MTREIPHPHLPPGLPECIAAFYAAEAADDAVALAACFETDGVVRDEGGTHAGHAAIAAWMNAARARYSHGTEALEARRDDEAWTVKVRVSGTFPGSPIEIRQRFRLGESRIAALEIG